MEINYQETSKDLLTRIDIHEKYGSANIDQWTTDLLQPQSGMNILDIGCGAGKLCFLFDDYTKGAAKITGGDFSQELLGKARTKNKERGSTIVSVGLGHRVATSASGGRRAIATCRSS